MVGIGLRIGPWPHTSVDAGRHTIHVHLEGSSGNLLTLSGISTQIGILSTWWFSFSGRYYIHLMQKTVPAR